MAKLSPIYKICLQYTTRTSCGVYSHKDSHQSTKFVFNTQRRSSEANFNRCHQSTKFVFNTQQATPHDLG